MKTLRCDVSSFSKKIVIGVLVCAPCIFCKAAFAEDKIPFEVLSPPYSKETFFDFSFAESIWKSGNTLEEFSNTYLCHVTDRGSYRLWVKSHKENLHPALKNIENYAESSLIKRCHDVHLTYVIFKEVYWAWRKNIHIYGGDDWGVGKSCPVSARVENIFDHSCSNLPKWRTLKDIMEDERRLFIGNTHRSKK